MTHEETIKRIQKLVPSIMALEFGCEVKIDENWMDKTSAKYNEIIIDTKNEMFEEEGECIRLYFPTSELLVNADVINVFNGTKALRNEHNWDVRILGKPITLATILLAIWLNKSEWLNNNDTTVLIELVKVWNLSKDNFNDQSEETKTFIGELLN